jgi:nitrogen regulatory protein PII
VDEIEHDSANALGENLAHRRQRRACHDPLLTDPLPVVPRPTTAPDRAMKQLLVIVKPFLATSVLSVAARHEVHACTVDEVKGYGRQKNYLDRYKGSEYSLAFLPKVEISIWAEDGQAEALAKEIAHVAHTGLMGDGKIFITEAGWPEVIEF